MDQTNVDKMTTCQKKVALQYLIFLKQKIRGKIKGMGCADSRKICKCITKDNTIAPTVATEALFLTCLTNTMEHREVAAVKLPWEFMQANMEVETVHMKM